MLVDLPRLACIGATFACLLLPSSSVVAGDIDAFCYFRALTNDPDPAGTNIRSGPGAGHDVLAVLPHSIPGPSGEYRPEFRVMGFNDGWFKITDIRAGQYDGGEETVLFSGQGWISAALVTVWIEGAVLHEYPAISSTIDFDLAGAGSLPEEAIITKFLGCSGPFVHVVVERPDGATGQGWTEDICANQVTTCS